MSDSASPKKWWQFSLRELLILMVAVAAVVALFVQNRPRRPTSFYDNFNPQAELESIGSSQSLPVDISGSSQNSGGGPNSAQLEASFYLRSPSLDELQSKIMTEWRSRIFAKLQQQGCDPVGNSQSGKRDRGSEEFDSLSSFGLRYRKGATRGILRIYALRQSESQSRVLVLLDEF